MNKIQKLSKEIEISRRGVSKKKFSPSNPLVVSDFNVSSNIYDHALVYEDCNLTIGTTEDKRRSHSYTHSCLWVYPVETGKTSAKSIGEAAFARRQMGLVGAWGMWGCLASTLTMMAVFVNAELLVYSPLFLIAGAIMHCFLSNNFLTPAVRFATAFSDYNDSSGRLLKVLENHHEPVSVTGAVRRKYASYSDGKMEGVVNEANFCRWLDNLCKIIELDSTFSPDLVPLTVEHSSTVLKKLTEKAKQEAAKQRLIDEAEGKIVQSRREREQAQLNEEAADVLELALAHLNANMNEMERVKL